MIICNSGQTVQPQLISYFPLSLNCKVNQVITQYGAHWFPTAYLISMTSLPPPPRQPCETCIQWCKPKENITGKPIESCQSTLAVYQSPQNILAYTTKFIISNNSVSWPSSSSLGPLSSSAGAGWVRVALLASLVVGSVLVG